MGHRVLTPQRFPREERIRCPVERAGCLPPDARARAPGTAGTRVGMELRRSLSPLLVRRSEVERLLERELGQQRSLRQDDRMAADVEQRPADSVRFAVVPSGLGFDVLLFVMLRVLLEVRRNPPSGLRITSGDRAAADGRDRPLTR